MPLICKIKFILLLGISFVVMPKTLLAQQPPSMSAVRAQISKQFINEQMKTTQNMRLNNFSWKDNAGSGVSYKVTFKDSLVIDVTSFIYTDSVSHKDYLIYVDKKYKKSDSAHRFKKIYADQTLYIGTAADDISGRVTYGVPLDSCWMFKVLSGKINVYAKYFKLYESGFVSSNIIALQLDDEGPIVKYTEDTLKQMLGNNAAALAYFEEKKYYKAVKKYNKDAFLKVKK